MSLDAMSEEGPPQKISMPTEETLKSLPESERLAQAAQAASAAANAEGLVATLRQKASAITNPAERERLLTQAFNREIDAKGLSKKARILKSGTFQGGVAGVGIGAASAAGLGTAVGTLVGTVTSIPATLVGGLVGMGTGAIHGPWVKLGGGEKGNKEELVQIPQEQIDNGAVKIDEKTGQVTARDPEKLKAAAAAAQEAANARAAEEQREGAPKERRKPKKLEIRNKEGAKQKEANTDSQPAKRKPKKLEIRSKQVSTAA